MVAIRFVAAQGTCLAHRHDRGLVVAASERADAEEAVGEGRVGAWPFASSPFATPVAVLVAGVMSSEKRPMRTPTSIALF